MKARWLFVCSCIALITSAFTFVVRGDVLQQLGNDFQFNQAQRGGIEGAVFLGMAISMFVGGFICDALGMKKIMWLAFASHLIGSVGTIIAPYVAPAGGMSYYWLYATSLLMGFGNGFTEVAINPLVATLYPNQKTHYLNILHAWWPGGLVIGGIMARLVGGGLQLTGEQPTIPGMGFNWQISLGLIVLPAIIYGIMLVPAVFPHTERVASGVSTGDMFKEVLRPMFLLWAFCMLLTAATELGPQKWQESVISSTTKGAVSGTLILVYTSGMMFVLRHFAGPIAHKLSPTGMLIGSSILAGTGLYLLSFANSPATAFGYATIFGLGIAYFWPTMLGVSAERFPKGGALILALMGTAGNISISYVLPQMGKIADHYSVSYVEKNDSSLASTLVKGSGSDKALNEDEIKKLQAEEKESGTKPAALVVAESAQREGFSWAFRWVSLLPALLVVLFGGIFLYDKARGGYKPEVLMSREEENELFAGGVQAEVQ